MSSRDRYYATRFRDPNGARVAPERETAPAGVDAPNRDLTTTSTPDETRRTRG